MSTMFGSVEEAKGYVGAVCGVNPDTFEEIEGLKVAGMEAFLLDDPDTSEEIKKAIRDRIETQKGFKFIKDDQEVKIVIGPFRSGFDCWVVGNNGGAMRL